MKTLIEQVKAARRVNTPIITISTPDQWATVETVHQALNGVPKWQWDGLRGLRGANKEGEDAIAVFGEPAKIAAKTGNPRAMLDFIQQAPPKTTIMMHNAHRFIDDPVVATGIGVVRDPFKNNKRTLFLLSPSMTLPTECQQDVVMLEEPMPDDEQLGQVLTDLYQGAKGVPKCTDQQRTEAIAATRGLSSFLAEETFAMSLSKEKGLDVEECWERKRKSVNQTEGLTFCPSGTTFDDVRSLDQVSKFMSAVFNGKNPPQAVLRIDEIDKHMAGATGGDLSGTSSDQLGVLLRWMEDEGHTGFIAIGPGGAGKSLVSKAIGGTFNVPTMEADLGGAKGKGIVGSAEATIRQLVKVASGVAGGGRILVVATCNRMAALPPELRRRFTMGTWMFDLPTKEGRAPIWKLYKSKYGLTDKKLPNDEGWTGAEIRNCCEMAANLGVPITEAAQYIVPVIKSAPEQVRELREMAHSRYLNAASEGVFINPDAKPANAAPTGRQFDVED